MSELILIADDREYTGWKSAAIFRSLQHGPHQFEMTISPEQTDTGLFEITDGTACEIWFNDDLILTGYIDDVLQSYSKDRHDIRLTGRSKIADLVDCSTNGEQVLKGQSLQSLATKLASPFNVTVAADPIAAEAAQQTFEVSDITLDPGQPVWQLLEELARLRGVLLISGADGGLVITRANTSTVLGAITYGDGVLSAESRRSHRELFSEYSVCGMQALWAGSAADKSQSASAVKGNASRHRPWFIQAEDQADAAACNARAAHQARVSYGRSRSLQYTVSGWRTNGATGQVWQPNRLVSVSDPVIGMEGDLLAIDVAHSYASDTGHVTTLTLMPAEAFDLIAQPQAGGATW